MSAGKLCFRFTAPAADCRRRISFISSPDFRSGMSRRAAGRTSITWRFRLDTRSGKWKTGTAAMLRSRTGIFRARTGVYHIPGCAKGEPFALLIIKARGDALDLGENRRFPFTITARQIAEDLLQDLHDHGIFICEGARPSSGELATARREGFYQKLITEGDTMWARGHSFREISDLHRRAAMALGVEREWAYVPMRMGECPACGEKVKIGVAVCRYCGAILDEEKAAKHGLGAGAGIARGKRVGGEAENFDKRNRG